MKLVKREGIFRIYELTESECKQFGRVYPTLVCWSEEPGTVNEDIGNLNHSETETETLEEMVAWCKEHS